MDMSKILDFVGLVLMIFVASAVLIFTIEYAIDKQERGDCYKWQQYEAMYPRYETHPDTALRCSALGVDVYADILD